MEIIEEDIDECIYMLKTSETKKEFKSKYIDIVREKLKYKDLNYFDAEYVKKVAEN